MLELVRRFVARHGRVAALIGALATLLAASPAGATFVFYFRTFGDWSLICALDEPSGQRTCSLSAPPPEMAASRSVLSVEPEANGRFALKVRALGALTPGAPLYLRIDGNPPRRATPDRLGEAVWEADAARELIDEISGGTRLVLRSFVGEDADPRDEVVSLDGFPPAMEVYREKLRNYGVITTE